MLQHFEDVCKAVVMHRIAPENLNFLTTAQKKELQCFKKYGFTTRTDNQANSFISELIDEEYKSFKSLPFANSIDTYKQFIANPKRPNGYITLADCASSVHLGNSVCPIDENNSKPEDKKGEK